MGPPVPGRRCLHSVTADRLVSHQPPHSKGPHERKQDGARQMDILELHQLHYKPGPSSNFLYPPERMPRLAIETF